MRKIFSLVCILAAAGAALSGYLVWIHFAGGTGNLPVWAPCSAADSGCSRLAQSSFSSVAGIPVASFGLFYYLWMAGAAAAVVFSGYISSPLIMIYFMAAVFGLGADIGLAGILVYTKSFCELCIATYCINILLVIIAGLLLRRERLRDADMLEKIASAAVSLVHERKKLFYVALFGAFSMLTALTVASGTAALYFYSDGSQCSSRLVGSYLDAYKKTSVEKINMPPSKLVTGAPDAAVKVMVFSDPFCGGCRAFYKTEQKAKEKFGDNVVFIHYMLPLDKKCNSAIKSDLHPYSCLASRQFYAAAETGIYEEFAREHFDRYDDMLELYNAEMTPENFLKKILPDKNIAAQFSLKTGSVEAAKYVARDVDFAHSLNIRKTPTLIINGRRFEGAPSPELFEKIIISELRGE